ncbi:hypothetical protein [Arcobacter sp. YIC-310]
MKKYSTILILIFLIGIYFQSIVILTTVLLYGVLAYISLNKSEKY